MPFEVIISKSFLNTNVFFVKRLVDKHTFNLRPIVNPAFHLLHPQNGASSVFKLNKNGADLRTQLFLSVSNNLEKAHLPDVLHLGLEIILQLFVHLDCHLHLTVENV